MPVSKNSSHATIADVARQAGVSIATVSRVINKTAPVADETAVRVRAAIAKLNYVPQAAARRLARGRTNALGLIVDVISVPFFAPLLQGIEGAAREAGFYVLIHCLQSETSPGPGFSRPLGPHNTDGLLVFAGALGEAELIQVHGYRRIAFLKGPESQEDSYWRERGYREALEAHGIPFDPALVGVGGVKACQAQASVEQWLSKGVSIDAVFAWDDDSALEVIQALQQAGRRVPDDVAVVGFDDIHLAHYTAPPLTTIRVPVEQAGREAVCQLVRLIETGHADLVTLLSTQLIIRRSCGCDYPGFECTSLSTSSRKR
jgi:DNA-binding LacI/PurR family transcriptional regulator